MLSKMTDRIQNSPVAPASLGHTWGAVPPLPPSQDSAEGTGNSC